MGWSLKIIFIIWEIELFLRNTAHNPERARYGHLARSGSQSQCRIRFLLELQEQEQQQQQQQPLFTLFR